MSNHTRKSNEPFSGEPDPNESPITKRPNLTRDDRLSELPDLALVHILSHLYIEEAARTVVLSKRFNSLWNWVTELSFSDENYGKSGEKFVKFVKSALGFHSRGEIENFSVKFLYSCKYSKIVNNWIKFATRKQVKSLHMDFSEKRSSGFSEFGHNLPKFLYDNEILVELVTKCCKFSEKRELYWKSLKLLSISDTKLSEGLISRVLAGCPVLETLELKEWSGFNRLKINSVSLRVLRLVGELSPKFVILPNYEYLLEISGPNLMSLEISGPLYRTKVRLSDVGSLVSAKMDFERRPFRGEVRGLKSCWFNVRDQDIAREVLESLCLVKALTVGGWFIKALSMCEAYHLSPPWSERKSLTLCIPDIKWDRFGVMSFLHSSPYLERLVIRLSYNANMCGTQPSHDSVHYQFEEYFWTSWSTISKCPLLHLKTVKVVDFQASCGVMKRLFQFL